MERAARNVATKVALAGLLTAAGAACATMEEPPGGPPDFAPPTLLTMSPDSGVVLDGFSDDVEFQFDEVISETGGGGLEQLFRISPRHDEIKVSWKRKRLTVRPRDRWRDSVVYQVSMLPGIADLRNNRLEEGRTVVFSTGGPIPDTRFAGTVIDWEGGRIVENALIEVIRVSDSLTYIGSSDSLGDFELHAIPPGRYLIQSVLDQNSNDRRESRESFDSITVMLDSVFTHIFWAFQHDTVGPRIAQVTLRDSLAIGVEFNQSLSTDLPGPEAVSVRALPDSTPVAVEDLLTLSVFDSLRAAAADSARQDSIVADSAAVPDTTSVPARDTTVVAPAPGDTLPVAPPDTAVTPADTAATAESDTSRVSLLLRQRPALTRSLVITVAEPLVPGARYVVEATVTNLLGATEQSLQPLVLPEAPAEPPPPAARDTT